MENSWIIRKAVKEDKEKIEDLFIQMLRSIYHKEDVTGYEEGYLDLCGGRSRKSSSVSVYGSASGRLELYLSG